MIRKMTAAGNVLLAVATGLVVTSASASAAADCTAVHCSASGHEASTLRSSGSGSKYAREATACGPGSCEAVTGSFVCYGKTAYFSAGSGYIDQNTFRVVYK